MSDTLAPELPPTLEWLNLPSPLRMADLHGRVCALGFVNAGSAWSLQRLQDLARLQARHGDKLQVLAVHVPRSDSERDARRIAQRFGQHDFGFPIAHDPDWIAWQHYDIEAWPTVVLIDGHGAVRERFVGAGSVRELDTAVASLCAALDVTPDPAAITLWPHGEPTMPLRFPTGLAVSGHYLYIADSGHHRVLECDQAGRVLREFGDGDSGLRDGPATTAAFNRPHGLCLHRDTLYVADSGNHAVRRIDLRSGDVATVLGTGRQGQPIPGVVSAADAVFLDQPCAVEMTGETLLIACRGDNRLWQFDLGTMTLHLVAGSGDLAVLDGAGTDAAFAEPVALAAVQQLVYVCDSAGSAIRSVNVRNRQVSTLVGQAPWIHGHADGTRSDARLQHPQAIALDPDAPVLWIADSGNDLLRTLRLGGGEVGTFSLSQPLHGPSGLAIGDGVVWIADSDAHAVLRLDTRTGAIHHVPVGE